MAFVLKMRWADGLTLYLTKDGDVKNVPLDGGQVREFPTREAADQYLRQACGVQCDLYVSFVGGVT
jgi:hypothetical protein